MHGPSPVRLGTTGLVNDRGTVAGAAFLLDKGNSLLFAGAQGYYSGTEKKKKKQVTC